MEKLFQSALFMHPKLLNMKESKSGKKKGKRARQFMEWKMDTGKRIEEL